MFMENFIAAMIVMMSLSVATLQVVRNIKYKELAERRHRVMPVILYTESLMIMCDLCSGGMWLGMRLVSDVMLAVIPLSVLSSSLWNGSSGLKTVYACWCVMAMMSMYYILCSFGLSRHLPLFASGWVIVLLVLVYVLLFLLGVWYRVREVRAVMQAGTVWAGISLATEAVYVVIVLLEVVVLMALSGSADFIGPVVALLLGGAMAACGLRIASDSLFVLLKRHERRIVESMKISPVEVSGMEADDVYKDIYERVLEYFDRDKPFLNGDLTINDVVSVVFTNKLYISRAISQHTGRNFCQFVNYHRVMYSVDCFRKNPDLKVTELWSMCGFNTIVSYNMAFKLFMGENPSDWCRKEKVRIFRRLK